MMKKSDIYLIKCSLFIFLSLVIMNSIKFNNAVTIIGSVGKLVFCSFFIFTVLLLTRRPKYNLRLFQKLNYILIFALIVFFSFLFFIAESDSKNLLANIAIPIYLYFFYLLSKLFIRINTGENFLLLSKIEFFKVFRFTLFFHICLWFPIALIIGLNMFEVDGGFGGFFQDEIHFGLYMVTGFLVCFYLRYNQFKSDKSLSNLVQMLIFLLGAMFASRNALLIILTAVTFFFVISRVKNKFYMIAIILLPSLLLNVDTLLAGFSVEKINELSSGRFVIWQLAVTEIFDGGYLIGKGLFNLNGVVLNKNTDVGIYYFDDLETLSFHSSYVELFAGGGLVALILFFRLIFKIWKRFSNIEKGIVIGILIGAIFESFLMQPFMLIPCLFYFILIINSLDIEIKKRMEKLFYS